METPVSEQTLYRNEYYQNIELLTLILAKENHLPCL